MREVVELEAEGPSVVAFPWAAAGRGHSPSCAHFQAFPLAGVVPPKRQGYTGLAACENKWCLLKHSKPGAAVGDGDEIHPGGDGPPWCAGCECRTQGPWAECLGCTGTFLRWG